MQLKERKEMDDSFKKAQKHWAGLLSKVNKAKAEYYKACKTEKSLVNQERNASADTTFSPDQVVSCSSMPFTHLLDPKIRALIFCFAKSFLLGPLMLSLCFCFLSLSLSLRDGRSF